ncbi:hypothetical protein E3407_RS04690 [Enterococcus hirae]
MGKIRSIKDSNNSQFGKGIINQEINVGKLNLDSKEIEEVKGHLEENDKKTVGLLYTVHSFESVFDNVKKNIKLEVPRTLIKEYDRAVKKLKKIEKDRQSIFVKLNQCHKNHGNLLIYIEYRADVKKELGEQKAKKHIKDEIKKLKKNISENKKTLNHSVKTKDRQGNEKNTLVQKIIEDEKTLVRYKNLIDQDKKLKNWKEKVKKLIVKLEKLAHSREEIEGKMSEELKKYIKPILMESDRHIEHDKKTANKVLKAINLSIDSKSAKSLNNFGNLNQDKQKSAYAKLEGSKENDNKKIGQELAAINPLFKQMDRVENNKGSRNSPNVFHQNKLQLSLKEKIDSAGKTGKSSKNVNHGRRINPELDNARMR